MGVVEMCVSNRCRGLQRVQYIWYHAELLSLTVVMDDDSNQGKICVIEVYKFFCLFVNLWRCGEGFVEVGIKVIFCR